MDKTYGSDTAKATSRERFRDFIKIALKGALQTPQKIKVMCLESPEALEITQVYDAFGIPRKNIIVVERDRIVAEEIVAKKLGVKVINTTTTEFFNTWKGHQFQILSLDTKGKISEVLHNDIHLIAKHQLLASPSVLMVNTLARREKEEKQLLKGASLIQRNLAEILTIRDEDGSYFNAELYLQALAHRAGKRSNLSQCRDDYTKSIIQILSLGIDIIHRGQLFEECYPHSIQMNKSLSTGSLWPEMMSGFQKHLYDLQNMQSHLLRLLGFESDDQLFVDALFVMLQEYFYKGYLTKMIERYAYSSNTSSPMQMDIFKLQSADKEWPVIGEIFNFHYVYGHAHITLEQRKKKRAQIDRLVKLLDNYIGAILSGKFFTNKSPLPERVHLGSSPKVLRRTTTKRHNKQILELPKSTSKDLITKEQAIALLKDGCSPAEIAECFDGFSKNTLKAIKAHITMGTYADTDVSK